MGCASVVSVKKPSTLLSQEKIVSLCVIFLVVCSHAGDQRGPGERQLVLGGAAGRGGEASGQPVRRACLSVQHPVRPRLHERSSVAYL